MTRWILLCGVLLFELFVTHCHCYADQPINKLDPANTYAVIVGVLNWHQESLTTYPAADRQDVELHSLLKRRGVPEENMVLLLDESATRDAINDAVEEVAKKAAKNSTLIIYYAGHGMKKGDEGIFACYDIRTRTMQQTGWRHRSLSNSILANFRGSNVLLFADCCFSGSLEDVAGVLGRKGYRAASLTSASSTNLSTSNWTFTVGLIEALSGAPIVDANRDGVVTISEANKDTKLAMAQFEQQRHGFSTHNLPLEFQLAESSTDGKDDELAANVTTMGYQRGQYVVVQRKTNQEIGRILGGNAAQAQLLVQIQGYSERESHWVDVSGVSIREQPKLKDEPPDPLPPDEAKQKASLDGRLTKLLTKIHVPSDFVYYGEFDDFGIWNGKQYADRSELPTGHWVYVYPNWYIWESDDQEPLMQIAEVVQNANIAPYDAKQMVGKPDTPLPGDQPTAWASLTPDDENAWVELSYGKKLTPKRVLIYENHAPGAVYQVSCFVDGVEKRLWKGVDPTPVGSPMGVSKIPIKTDEQFSKIRVYIRSKKVPGWNEIDAVGLVGTNDKVHWAVDAKASCTYNQNNAIEFVDPLLTKEEKIAEMKTEILAEIRRHKTTIRQHESQIADHQKVIDSLFQKLTRHRRLRMQSQRMPEDRCVGATCKFE